jgi:hypothetical protein
MGSGAVIYVPSFIKIGSGIPKSIGGIHGQENKESGLKSDFLSSYCDRVRCSNDVKIKIMLGGEVENRCTPTTSEWRVRKH